MDNSSDNTRISLVDLTGKIIFDHYVPNNNKASLKVSDLPRGYYSISDYTDHHARGTGGVAGSQKFLFNKFE